MNRGKLTALIAACLVSTGAMAQSEHIVVIGTRVPESIGRIPADISVVSGSDLQTRGARDLSSTMALVSGVDAPSGGDAGPSSAVPSFWGLHEFDAFLLVVDGVPWGGAFNPGISSLNLNDVEHIEVLKGAAPVMYGATSFVGVVDVLHYPAGQASNQAEIAFGSYDSVRGSASLVLPQWGDYRQSLAVDGQRLGFADKRESVGEGHLLYRGALDLGAGTLRLDASLTIVRDAPTSPVLRAGTALTSVTPINANFNPPDAQLDENKYQLSLSYSRPTRWGRWDTTVSLAHSDIVDVRAFLHPDLSGTADTQDQHRLINDNYFDTHVTSQLSDDLTLVVGADLLHGVGRQASRNGNDAFTVPLDGSAIPPAASSVTVNEVNTTADQRIFAGQYAEIDWQPSENWDVVAGLRLNETYEHKSSSNLDLESSDLLAEGANKTVVRPVEIIGASYRIWSQDSDEAVLYADYRNTFKPAAIDFGPDYTPEVLLPETAQSYEGGIKGTLARGRLSYQAEFFLQNFQNLVVSTSSGSLTNAAKERLKGAEFEARYQATPDLALAANVAYHDARYGQYVFFDGTSDVNVSGRQLVLSPQTLASAGLIYSPPRGFNATLTANYVGKRYLDEENTAPVGAYATLAATVGYRFGQYSVSLEGTNLTNQRPPVTASEFGSESFYLLPARTLWLRLGTAL